MPSQNPPLHTHDCSRCTFLGSDGECDFYYCPQGGLPTLIARWGSAGPEYTSCLLTSVTLWERDGTGSPPLVKALRLAREQGVCA